MKRNEIKKVKEVCLVSLLTRITESPQKEDFWLFG